MQLLITGKETGLLTSTLFWAPFAQAIPFWWSIPLWVTQDLSYHFQWPTCSPTSWPSPTTPLPEVATPTAGRRSQYWTELAILVQSGILAPTTALLSVLQFLISYFLWPAPSSCCSLQTQSTELLPSLLMLMLRFTHILNMLRITDTRNP